MTLSIGSSASRVGNLAQANSFGGYACAPTSVANALLALGEDSLMQGPSEPGSWESLYETRNNLAENYFFTSVDWEKGASFNPKLPSPDYLIAGGSLPSQVLKGTINYINDRQKLQQPKRPVTVSVKGLVSGSIQYRDDKGNPTARVPMNFGGFDVQAVINGKNITSPSLVDYQNYFTQVDSGNSYGILDFLMQGLLRGPVVFGMYYTNAPAGHAVTATDIQINDSNANGVIERGEATISFIDPLNPSQAYSPTVGATTDQEAFNRIKSDGAVKLTKGEIWQNEDGYLTLNYEQQSLALDNGRISLPVGDASNNRLGQGNVTAAITLAMALNTSGLGSDFDKIVGSSSQVAPGLTDFSSFIIDPVTADKVLSGYVYSNESSSYSNQFRYYECIDASGTVKFSDPITGQLRILMPSDAGYSNAAWTLAQGFSGEAGAVSMGYRESTDSETLTKYRVDLSKLSNGYLAPIALTSKGDIWSPFAAANVDKQQHFLSTGPLSWRMEDQRGLGDRDFNDLHVSMLIESIL